MVKYARLQKKYSNVRQTNFYFLLSVLQFFLNVAGVIYSLLTQSFIKCFQAYVIASMQLFCKQSVDDIISGSLYFISSLA